MVKQIQCGLHVAIAVSRVSRPTLGKNNADGSVVPNFLSECCGSGASQKKPSKGSHKRNILGWIVRDEFLILEEQICSITKEETRG